MTPARTPRSPKAVKARAKELRQAQTAAERVLWDRLRNRGQGAKFRRQVPIGPFIVDFYCPASRLVVEIDGEVHAGETRAALDKARTEWLEERGYRVARFRNEDITDRPDAVLGAILAQLPSPVPRERGRG